MNFKIFGKKGAPTLMLIPGLGVSYEIFMPLIEMLEDRFHIIAVEVGGFILGGKILSRILERNEIRIGHAIMDAAPLLPLPRLIVGPLKSLHPETKVEVFKGMNHGQLLIDHPYIVAGRIIKLCP